LYDLMDMFEAEEAQKKLYDMKPHELYMHLALQGERLLLGCAPCLVKQPTLAAALSSCVFCMRHSCWRWAVFDALVVFGSACKQPAEVGWETALSDAVSEHQHQATSSDLNAA
jgi:hypothetical protein